MIDSSSGNTANAAPGKDFLIQFLFQGKVITETRLDLIHMKKDIQAHLLDGIGSASDEEFDSELILGTRRSTRLQKTQPAPKPAGRRRGRGRGRSEKPVSSSEKKKKGRGRGRGRGAYDYEYTSSENDIDSKLEDDDVSEESEKYEDISESGEGEGSSEESSDSFSEYKKKEENKNKTDEDLSKMTKRQKQAYLVKNNIIEITEQSVNKKTGNIGFNSETVLYSLDPSRSGKNSRIEMPRRVRKHKTITLEEQAEKQTNALQEILDEISRKEKDCENKEKNSKKLKKEKEEEELRELKRKQKLNSVRIYSSVKPQNQSFSSLDPKFISTVSFPKCYNSPIILNQSIDSIVQKLEEKSRNQKCDNCNINKRKYLCKLTGKVSCSYECYRENKQKMK